LCEDRLPVQAAGASVSAARMSRTSAPSAAAGPSDPPTCPLAVCSSLGDLRLCRMLPRCEGGQLILVEDESIDSRRTFETLGLDPRSCQCSAGGASSCSFHELFESVPESLDLLPSFTLRAPGRSPSVCPALCSRLWDCRGIDLRFSEAQMRKVVEHFDLNGRAVVEGRRTMSFGGLSAVPDKCT
jgi:hypothetical protein